MKEIITSTTAAIGFIAVIALIMTLPTYFLWNWLMPDIFGLTEISLGQALGIAVLSNILFKSPSSSSS